MSFDVILYSYQLKLAFPKILAPLTTDPAAGTDDVPDVVAVGLAPAAIVATAVVPVAGDDGVVLAQPAIATAMMTRMITMTLVPKIFNLIPPDII
jgi:hypothetical protein